MKRQIISGVLIFLLGFAGLVWISAASLSANSLALNTTAEQKCIAEDKLPTQFGCVERGGGAASDYITNIYKYALTIGAILAVIMVIYGGYQYVISQGSPDAATLAKETIFYALAGLALLILAYLILRTIQVDIFLK